MTPPSAAGMRTSHSSVSSECGSIAYPPSKPLIPRFSTECFTSLGMSRPLMFLTAPVTSLIAITLPPASVIS
uniref:Gdh1 n=1 Tax=Arundo donax TaxID=35708 RepID=A0A0A9E5P1_ARUDO